MFIYTFLLLIIMKKGGKEVSKGFIYFFSFMFLGLLLISSSGVYDNAITGSAIDTGGIGDSIQGAIQIITQGLIGPILGEIVGESSNIIIKFILWIVLFSLISGILTKGDKMNKTTANIISGLIPLIGVAFLPERFISALGPIGAFLITTGLVIYGYKWLYYFQEGKFDFFSKAVRIGGSILMIVALTMMTPWFVDVFEDVGDLYYMAVALGVAIGVFFMVYFFMQGGSGGGSGSGSGSGGYGSGDSPNDKDEGNDENFWEKMKNIIGGKDKPPKKPEENNVKGSKREHPLKGIRNYYSILLGKNEEISKELNKPSPDFNKIKINLGAIGGICKRGLSMTILRGGLGISSNGELIQEICRGINKECVRLIKDLNKGGTIKKGGGDYFKASYESNISKKIRNELAIPISKLR